MASFQKRGNKWRAQVAIDGERVSGTFRTKAEAVSWAAEQEAQIRQAHDTGIIGGKTLADAFDRYGKEVSAHKPGERWEIVRMAKIARHMHAGVNWGSMQLTEFTPDIIGAWRDYRMSIDNVTGSTVVREIKLLSHLFNTAANEWRWINGNPTKNVRRPKQSKARDRLYTDDEIRRLCLNLGFDDSPVSAKRACVAVAFLFAIETGMRAGEICGLKREDITGRVAHLHKTKNGDERDVPLSARALELIDYLPADENTLFVVSASSLDALFRDARDRCGIVGATFHDTRHLAITRLAQKLSPLELARMVGHRNLNQLMTYYNARAEDLADKL